MTAANIRPGRRFKTHGAAAAVLVTHTRTCVALWIGEAGVLFYRSAPVALIQMDRVVVAPNLPSSTIRYIARWLRENSFPIMNRSMDSENFNAVLLRAMLFELGRMF